VTLYLFVHITASIAISHRSCTFKVNRTATTIQCPAWSAHQIRRTGPSMTLVCAVKGWVDKSHTRYLVYPVCHSALGASIVYSQHKHTQLYPGAAPQVHATIPEPSTRAMARTKIHHVLSLHLFFSFIPSSIHGTQSNDHLHRCSGRAVSAARYINNSEPSTPYLLLCGSDDRRRGNDA
jgi:hypothetical protein